MTTDPDPRVQRAGRTDLAEVARFQASFDNEFITEETKRFLADDRHHLVLGYVDDRPAGFASAVEVFHPIASILPMSAQKVIHQTFSVRGQRA